MRRVFDKPHDRKQLNSFASGYQNLDASNVQPIYCTFSGRHSRPGEVTASIVSTRGKSAKTINKILMIKCPGNRRQWCIYGCAINVLQVWFRIVLDRTVQVSRTSVPSSPLIHGPHSCGKQWDRLPDFIPNRQPLLTAVKIIKRHPSW